MRSGKVIGVAILVALALPAHARDDGRFAASPLKSWFDKLASGKGLCCSISDGRTVDDPDWGTESVAAADGKATIVYWVVVDWQRLVVPPDALVTEPNRFGRAVVWPIVNSEGHMTVRCFLPGAQG